MADTPETVTETAAIDTIQALREALLRVVGEALVVHGDDPESGAIVATAFVMAIEDIGQRDPRVPAVVRAMLEGA